MRSALSPSLILPLKVRNKTTTKKLPAFKTEDQERNFWATADSTEYLDWPSAKRAKVVRLKPTLKTISLRLPLSMIQDLKILANRRDVPYQSLFKVSPSASPASANPS